MTATAVDIPQASARTQAIGVEDLGELLHSVNEVTARLQATHDALRTQVATLQQELAAANEQLRRSKSLAALGEMAAGIAHEVRNPLASVLLYAEMLESDLAHAPAQANTCRSIVRAVRGLDAIVKDILTFAQDRCAKLERIDVSRMIESARTSCEAMFVVHDVAFKVQLETDHMTIVGDQTLLVQAISNLVRNGVQAIEQAASEQREIVLDVATRSMRLADGKRRKRVVVAVEDSGPGIEPEVVNRMFNPFFTTRATGTGLGLAIVHRIVDAHGGEVDVTTRRGGGTRIELRLPLGASEDSGMVPIIETKPHTRGQHCKAMERTQ